MIKEIKGFLQKKEDEIIGIASTEKEDRDGEIIKQGGWDLENFKKNPVILASHNHHNFPIGKATEIVIEDGKLLFKAVFSKATEEAKAAYQLIKEGILNTFSVGFIPRERDQKSPNIITKSELLEISLVSIPSNSDAVVMAKSLKNNFLAKEIVENLPEGEPDVIEETPEEYKAGESEEKKEDEVEVKEEEIEPDEKEIEEQLLNQLKDNLNN